MKMFSAFLRFFRRPPKPLPERLGPQALEAALKEARFLYGRGAFARDLKPGEEPGEPEIGSEPIAREPQASSGPAAP